jgi:hypothetical protein
LRSLALVLLFTATASAESWDIKIPERVEMTTTAGGTLPINIVVDRGMSLSKDASIVIDLAPEPGVTVKRRRLGRTDAVDPEADAPRFSVPLRADNPGDFALRVRLRFWLCGQKVCKPVDAKRTVTVAVTASP